jgi:hypothetical protein
VTRIVISKIYSFGGIIRHRNKVIRFLSLQILRSGHLGMIAFGDKPQCQNQQSPPHGMNDDHIKKAEDPGRCNFGNTLAVRVNRQAI